MTPFGPSNQCTATQVMQFKLFSFRHKWPGTKKVKGLHSAHYTARPSSQDKVHLFASEGQRQGIGYRGKGRKDSMDWGKGYLPRRDKGLPLDEVESDVAHRQMTFYKGKRGNLVLGQVGFGWVC